MIERIVVNCKLPYIYILDNNTETKIFIEDTNNFNIYSFIDDYFKNKILEVVLCTGDGIKLFYKEY